MLLNPQAIALNDAIKAANPTLFDMLSEKGKTIFFPKKGILGQTAEAKGCKINATIGSALEDDGSTMCLGALAKYISLNPEAVFPYAPSFGLPAMRRKWKEMLAKKNPSLQSASLSLPVVTNALTHGLSMGGYMFCNPGEEIIVTDKFWGNYRLIFEQAYGVRFKTFSTFTQAKGFHCEALKEALDSSNPGKRIVLLNFPNNPTGYTPTQSEADEIVKIITDAAEAGCAITVFVDDAYFGLVYADDVMQESIFARLAVAHDRICAVKFDGPTKEDYVWGFRVGFVTVGSRANSKAMYEALEHKFSGAIRGNISNVSLLGQTLLLKAYEDPDYNQQKEQKYEILKRRYERICKILEENSHYQEIFEPLPFNSGYFMCVRLNNADTEAVRQRLLSEYSTGIIAQDDIIRIAFSSAPYHLLDELFESIYRAAKDVMRA